MVNVNADASLQLQGLNLNNAEFGFYDGNSDAKSSARREYSGRSLIMAVTYELSALPGTR